MLEYAGNDSNAQSPRGNRRRSPLPGDAALDAQIENLLEFDAMPPAVRRRC